MKKQGFTAMEVVVVMGIISVLFSFVLDTVNTLRDRGQAARVIQDVESIKSALQIRFSGLTRYPTEEGLEAAYAGSLVAGSITVQDMVEVGMFEGALARPPQALLGDMEYFYDSDGSDKGVPYNPGSCGSYTENDHGVNVIVTNAITTHPAVVATLDKIVDNGDGLTCGKVRRATPLDNSLIYTISVVQTQFP